MRSRVRAQALSRLGLTGAREAERLQEWGQKMMTVSWSTVGHVELVGLSLSGVREGACGALSGKLRRS